MMPSETMDERNFSPSSYFYDEMRFPAQRQVGFWKPESLPDRHVSGVDITSRTSTSKATMPSTLDRRLLMGAQSLEHPQFSPNQRSLIALEQHAAQSDRRMDMSMNSWRSVGHSLGTRSNIFHQPSSSLVESHTVDMNGIQHENGLFSSSLSEIFNKKLTLSSNHALFEQRSGAATFHYDEEEPFESLEELEAQTIGNLLPEDDDLLSGAFDELAYLAQPSNEDMEEFDLFSSGGGMELEGDSNGPQSGVNGSPVGEHPYGEHPSRTLFVRNINSNVEDSELKLLFEQYGDIRTLYTACKHRGFVMISYYDLRAARNAMRALQNKPLRRRKLDIHFSIPKDNPSDRDVNQGTLVVFNLDSSVSNDDLRQIFGVYGEIKEIRETPHKRHHKFIEYYDIRAAETALRSLNRTDIAGKRIKLEASRPGGIRRTGQQSSSDLEQDESTPCQQQESPPDDSSSGCLESVTHNVVTSGSIETGPFQELNSAVRPPIHSFLENGFHDGLSSSGSMRVASASNQSAYAELSQSFGQMKFGVQRIPNFHPHSLPEYHDSLANGLPFTSSGSIGNMSRSISSGPSEGLDMRHMHRVGASGHSRELNDSGSYNESLIFGSAGNGSCPLHGHQYAWNNSSAYRPHPPNPMMLPSSPSFATGFHAHPQSQVHGIPRAPSQLNSGVPVHHHHVGSAPAINPSLWDRRQVYPRDSPEASVFQHGAFGNMGFSANSGLHSLGLPSPDIFPRNSIDAMISSTLSSPQQRFHMFPSRNSVVPMPNSFDAPSERVRSRRHESSSNHGDNKKQFELDIDRILGGEDIRTTLMIKNIPNKYTSKMLLAAIDEQHRGTYDFIYLPIDFKNKCNVGYAFINMIDPIQIVPFYQAFNGKKWEKFNSEKVASLAYARIQGKAALVAHFQNSSLMNEDKRCRPILFHSDGPNAGDQEPFPMGVNIRSRGGKPRTSSYEESNQGSPSTTSNWEDSSKDFD